MRVAAPREGRLRSPDGRGAARRLMCALAALTVLSASARAQTGGICDRTSQVQTAILDTLSVSDCADVTASDLSRITLLGLSGTGTAALQSGDFAGLSNLERVWLRDNSLSTLPEECSMTSPVWRACTCTTTS